jgi:hypothetical protein
MEDREESQWFGFCPHSLILSIPCFVRCIWRRTLLLKSEKTWVRFSQNMSRTGQSNKWEELSFSQLWLCRLLYSCTSADCRALCPRRQLSKSEKGFEVLTTATLTIRIFWDRMTCIRNTDDSNLHGVGSEKIVIFKSIEVYVYDFWQMLSFRYPILYILDIKTYKLVRSQYSGLFYAEFPL